MPRNNVTGENVPPAKKRAFAAARAEGMSTAAASRAAGISRDVGTALNKVLMAQAAGREERRRNRGIPSTAGEGLAWASMSNRTMAGGRAGHGTPWANQYATLVGEDDVPPPVPPEDLVPAAFDSLGDFGLFRRRYLGRGPSPWQEDAAVRITEILLGAKEARDREFLVLNAPPSAGKSTLWHDLSVWLICRDRRIRILMGSRTTNQAIKYTRRIRRSLTQRSLLVPKEEDLRAGLAVMPEAVLAEDFGRFKPQGRDGDVWQMGGFTVMQPGESLTGEKEPTVTAFGFDADYLGMRVDLALWDDLVDPQNVRNADVVAALEETWDQVAEPRTDPGGLCVLLGQRIRHNDLYRHCLDKRRVRDLDDGEPDPEDVFAPKYHHVVYRAHDEARCRDLHRPDAPPQDPRLDADDPRAGCLLDPRRLPWRDLRTLMEEDPDTFRVVYQQEDLNPDSALVRKAWVDGGKDEATGTLYPGCWDHDRGVWQLPPAGAMVGANHVAVVIDPSPSNWWACQLWLYNHASERRYLIAVDRRRMQAPELIDWSHDRGCFIGFLEDWWVRATEIGLPFRYVVVEVNAAQRWLLQYDHATRWATKRGVNFVQHTTTARKTDEKQGIPAVKGQWRSGRIRLPGRPDGSRQQSELLVKEVLRWPNGATDDQVLAHWFFEFTLPRLSPRKPVVAAKTWRPSWAGSWRDRLTG